MNEIVTGFMTSISYKTRGIKWAYITKSQCVYIPFKFPLFASSTHRSVTVRGKELRLIIWRESAGNG